MVNVVEMMSLKGKVALVTGANSGIGAAMAEALAQAGADVAILDKSPLPDKDNTVTKVQSYGPQAKYYQGDITNAANCNRIAEAVFTDLGGLDILINCAGVCNNVPAEDMTWDDWYFCINVNLNGCFLVNQAVGRVMIKAKKGGSIVNISSMSAEVVNYPQPQCSYNASKAGVSQLTKSLAIEWIDHGIRVNAISPGYTDTPILIPGMSTPNGKIWLDMTPMHRIGQPYELTGLAIWLASDASTFATGGVYTVDGGYSLI